MNTAWYREPVACGARGRWDNMKTNQKECHEDQTSVESDDHVLQIKPFDRTKSFVSDNIIIHPWWIEWKLELKLILHCSMLPPLKDVFRMTSSDIRTDDSHSSHLIQVPSPPLNAIELAIHNHPFKHNSKLHISIIRFTTSRCLIKMFISIKEKQQANYTIYLQFKSLTCMQNLMFDRNGAQCTTSEDKEPLKPRSH